MIFDIILIPHDSNGLVNNYDFPLRLAKLPIYENVKKEYFNYSNDYYDVYGLCRDGHENDIFIDDFVRIFIVGECFSRIDSSYFKGNSRKLSGSDIKIILKKRGNNIVNDIKGNFQLLIIENDSITLINSRGGVSPFYYYKQKRNFICSTAIYLFPEHIKKDLKFSTSNILEYALFNYPLGENSLLQDVYNLLPGEIVNYQDGSLKKLQNKFPKKKRWKREIIFLKE